MIDLNKLYKHKTIDAYMSGALWIAEGVDLADLTEIHFGSIGLYYNTLYVLLGTDEARFGVDWETYNDALLARGDTPLTPDMFVEAQAMVEKWGEYQYVL